MPAHRSAPEHRHPIHPRPRPRHRRRPAATTATLRVLATWRRPTRATPSSAAAVPPTLLRPCPPSTYRPSSRSHRRSWTKSWPNCRRPQQPPPTRRDDRQSGRAAPSRSSRTVRQRHRRRPPRTRNDVESEAYLEQILGKSAVTKSRHWQRLRRCENASKTNTHTAHNIFNIYI